MRIRKKIFFGALLAVFLTFGTANGAGFSYQMISKSVPAAKWKTVIGWLHQQHTVAEGETLLDIARNFGLGWNEIEILYPNIDPWLPDPGTKLAMPVCWILPSGKHEGIVINIPEMRLYRYIPGTNMVETYPVGIGTEEFQTPLGDYQVVERQKNPVWTVPPSLRQKYNFTSMPPGPRNPLGAYWLGLSAHHIGIHGTNFPWAVGRQVSRGCIRLYPEDIKRLFPEVALGTKVHIIYEPVKVGVIDGDIYIEVHPDAEGKTTNDLHQIAMDRLQKLGKQCYVSYDLVKKAIQDKNGMPVRIGSIQGGGDEGAFRAEQKKNETLKEAIN